ncbi:dopamine receptor 1-like [Mizuhopecten yessoensis]|uniref:Dopamine receptor 1 n=1 Tax=Mizuhopecten yessoensis TaxID=6573 RepID=A0A210QD58_MIZYE|nr:dopamine receptor 1-like [Mizuhopecten yessoensis]OWF46660.1 Dopamine receptor 1 [Mizuhopecten yessoensis]
MVTNYSVFPSLGYELFDNGSAGDNISGDIDTETSGPYTLVESIVIGTILSLVIILAIAGNILVCVAVFTDRRLKHLNNLFIVSLAIADLLVAILVMTFAVVNDIQGRWLFGSVFCDIWISSDIMCSTASILNLCVISLDRYIHIRDPLRYENWITWKKVAGMISSVWIMSLIISFVPIHLRWHKNPEDYGKPPDENACHMDLNRAYAVVSSTISFYIPLIVMLAIYIQLYAYARKHAANIKKINTPLSQDRFNNANGKSSGSKMSDHKAAVTLGIIVGVFLFCWLPFFIMNLISAFCECDVPAAVFSILTWLGYANSFLNPIIYSIFNRDFRDAFKRILFPKSCKCIENRRHNNGFSHRSPRKQMNKSEYIMHPTENGSKRDCKEPLCSEMTAL